MAKEKKKMKKKETSAVKYNTSGHYVGRGIIRLGTDVSDGFFAIVELIALALYLIPYWMCYLENIVIKIY